jgi:hypothetical protein
VDAQADPRDAGVPGDSRSFWAGPLDGLLGGLGTDVGGLTSGEASRRRHRQGPNTIEPARGHRGARSLVAQFVTAAVDPGEDARLRVDFIPQLEDRNRLTVAFRLILVIPHLVVLAALAIAAFVVSVVGFFAVLFTGRWPAGARQFVLGVARWWLRVQSYLVLLHDQYPPFSLN